VYNVNIFITSYIDNAVIYGTEYPNGTLITATPLSYIKASWKYRLTEIILKEYFIKLKHSKNLIFNDGSNSCYMA